MKLLVLVLLVAGAWAKVVTLRFPVQELASKVTYLTKFGINLGDGTYKVKMRLVEPQVEDRPSHHRLLVYTDDYWPLVGNENSCWNKQALASYIERQRISFDGNWVEFERHLKLNYRDKIYIFAYSDCDEVLQFAKGTIEIQLELLNNGSQFPCDQKALHLLYLMQAVVSLVIGYYCLDKLKDQQDAGGFMYGLSLVLAVDFVAEVLLYLHYQIYIFNGKGFGLFDVLGSMLNNAANLLLSMLFLAVAMGWTISPNTNIRKHIPLGIAGILYQSVIMLVIKYFDDRDDKYHNFYGFGGLLLILSRIGIGGLYVVGISNLYKKFKQPKERQFLMTLGVVGTLFLLTYPITVFITEVFVAAYWRLRVITMTSILVGHLCIMYLVYICTSKKSVYFVLKNKSETIL